MKYCDVLSKPKRPERGEGRGLSGGSHAHTNFTKETEILILFECKPHHQSFIEPIHGIFVPKQASSTFGSTAGVKTDTRVKKNLNIRCVFLVEK